MRSGSDNNGSEAAAGSPSSPKSDQVKSSAPLPAADRVDHEGTAQGQRGLDREFHKIGDSEPPPDAAAGAAAVASSAAAAAATTAAAPATPWYKRVFASRQAQSPGGHPSPPGQQQQVGPGPSSQEGKDLPRFTDTPAKGEAPAALPLSTVVPNSPIMSLGAHQSGGDDNSGLLPVWSPPMGPGPLPPIGGSNSFSKSPTSPPAAEIEANGENSEGPALSMPKGLGGPMHGARLPPISNTGGFGGSSDAMDRHGSHRPRDEGPGGGRQGEAVPVDAEALAERALHDAMLREAAEDISRSGGSWAQAPRSSNAGQQGGHGGTVNGGESPGPLGPLAKVPPGVMASEQSMTNMLLTAAAAKAADLQGGRGSGGGGLTASRLRRPLLSAIMQDGNEQFRLSPGGVSGRGGRQGGEQRKAKMHCRMQM